MAIKGYSAFSKAPASMERTIRLFSVITGHLLGGGLIPLQRCSWCILLPQSTGQNYQGSTKTFNISSWGATMDIETDYIIGNLNLTHTHTHTYIYIYIYKIQLWNSTIFKANTCEAKFVNKPLSSALIIRLRTKKYLPTNYSLKNHTYKTAKFDIDKFTRIDMPLKTKQPPNQTPLAGWNTGSFSSWFEFMVSLLFDRLLCQD